MLLLRGKNRCMEKIGMYVTSNSFVNGGMHFSYFSFLGIMYRSDGNKLWLSKPKKLNKANVNVCPSFWKEHKSLDFS